MKCKSSREQYRTGQVSNMKSNETQYLSRGSVACRQLNPRCDDALTWWLTHNRHQMPRPTLGAVRTTIRRGYTSREQFTRVAFQLSCYKRGKPNDKCKALIKIIQR